MVPWACSSDRLPLGLAAAGRVQGLRKVGFAALDPSAHPGRGGGVLRLWCDAKIPHHRVPAALRLAHRASPRSSLCCSLRLRAAVSLLAAAFIGSMAGLSAVRVGTGWAPGNPQLMGHHRGLAGAKSKPVAGFAATQPIDTGSWRGSQPQSEQAGGAESGSFRSPGPCSPSQAASGAAQKLPADVNHSFRQTSEGQSPLRCASGSWWAGGWPFFPPRPIHPLASTRGIPLPCTCTPNQSQQPHHTSFFSVSAACSGFRYHFSCDAFSCGALVSRFCDISRGQCPRVFFHFQKDSYPFLDLGFYFSVYTSAYLAPSRLGCRSIHSQQHRTGRRSNSESETNWLPTRIFLPIKKPGTDVLGPADFQFHLPLS